MNEQLLKMNGLSVEIPNALSFKAHLWHEFKAVLNNVLSGSERSSIGVRPHKGVTRRKIVCYFFITILRIHAFQKKIWNPFLTSDVIIMVVVVLFNGNLFFLKKTGKFCRDVAFKF